MASPFDRSPDMDYFQSIEQAFIRLRGTPFQMSPDDYDVAGDWRRQEIPAEVVAEVLVKVVWEHESKGNDVPLRLAYYRPAVLATWKERRRLAAPGDTLDVPDFDLPGRLAALAAALTKGQASVSTLDLHADADAVQALVARAPDVEAIEEALALLDRELLDRAAGSLDDAGRRELDEQLDQSLAQLAARLPGGASQTARQRLIDELVRRRFDLPVLSLFSLDALADIAGERSSVG
ncbi:MAG: hypothetical protein AAGE94_21245 [Acidobacteriota bacterium]